MMGDTCGGCIDNASLRQQGLKLQDLLTNLAGLAPRVRYQVLGLMTLHKPRPHLSSQFWIQGCICGEELSMIDLK